MILNLCFQEDSGLELELGLIAQIKNDFFQGLIFIFIFDGEGIFNIGFKMFFARGAFKRMFDSKI